jgi:hypothetical protein
MNETIGKILRNTSNDFMLLLDSDIVLDISCPNMIDRLSAIARESEKFTNKPFGSHHPSVSPGRPEWRDWQAELEEPNDAPHASGEPG